MSVADLYLGLSVFGAGWTLQAILGLRTPYVFSVLYFLTGWLASALARYHIAWQVLATLGFAALGAFDATSGSAGRTGLVISGVSWLGLLYVEVRKRAAPAALAAALREALGPQARAGELAASFDVGLLHNPFKRSDPRVSVERDISYGPHGERNLLDVYKPSHAAHEPAPVLLWVHGGAWISGSKEQQGMPLIHTMVAQGWVCVAINYRLSPAATFPDHLVDCKRALGWVHEHIAESGGDPDHVVVAGGSAGAHLASLMAFSQNDAGYQPGFEAADTSMQACVALYGNFDFVNRFGRRNRLSDMRPTLEKQVMKCSRDTQREAWERASPVCCVTPDAPPFFVVHGTHDALLFVEETRDFVRELRAVAREPVAYAEIAGAQHGYDTLFTPYARDSALAVADFCEELRARKPATERAAPGQATREVG